MLAGPGGGGDGEGAMAPLRSSERFALERFRLTDMFAADRQRARFRGTRIRRDATSVHQIPPPPRPEGVLRNRGGDRREFARSPRRRVDRLAAG
jgi:hypothetical protein